MKLLNNLNNKNKATWEHKQIRYSKELYLERDIIMYKHCKKYFRYIIAVIKLAILRRELYGKDRKNYRKNSRRGSR